MQKTITLLLLAAVSNSFAQEISIKDGSERFSSGSHDCFITSVYENSKDDVMSKWKKTLNNFKDEKVSRSGDEVFGDNIVIKDWGNNPVDIYTKFDEDKDKKEVKMYVAIDLGGAYLKSSGDKDKVKYIEKLMKEFAVEMTKDAIKETLHEQEKIYSKLEDEQKTLEKENKNSKSDIEDYKAKIKKAEDEIKTNEADQVKKKAELETQKKVVDDVKKKLDKVD